MRTYQLRLRLTGYEIGYLRERIQRNSPQTTFEIPHFDVSHPILHIDSEETTDISADSKDQVSRSQINKDKS